MKQPDVPLGARLEYVFPRLQKIPMGSFKPNPIGFFSHPVTFAIYTMQKITSSGTCRSLLTDSTSYRDGLFSFKFWFSTLIE